MQAIEYMRQAIKLAKKAINPSPNPKVGCIIVNDGVVVGKGYHRFAGDHHAEIHALNEAGPAAQGATLHVTLEPCCHVGRTPPCTQAIMKAGIKSVYAATLDPNPLVAGKGMAYLTAQGIKTQVGLCEAAAKELNAAFFHYIVHKRPFVIAKWAMSLDGKTTTATHDDRQISNEQSHRNAHRFRASIDAILVGGETARKDNPLLTARIKQKIKQPLRIILTQSGHLPLDLALFSDQDIAPTLIVMPAETPQTVINRLTSLNIEILILPGKAGKVDLNQLLTELGRRQIMSLLVEGGMKVVENFIQDKLVNKVHLYLAPNIIAGLPQKQRIQNMSMKHFAQDLFFDIQV